MPAPRIDVVKYRTLPCASAEAFSHEPLRNPPINISIIFAPRCEFFAEFYTRKMTFLALDFANESYSAMHASRYINYISHLQILIAIPVIVDGPAGRRLGGIHGDWAGTCF